ncbi:hypothetical protein [Enterococcus sp. DIV0756]|uniref:hypothetical protein n=1 Tax=Enterococcus sp. DIV0756 TaxID=2774636 RepID=UPI003F23776E
MEEYALNDYLSAKKSLISTRNKIQQAIITLEEKQASGRKLKAQITLSRERVNALNLSLALIEREITRLS